MPPLDPSRSAKESPREPRGGRAADGAGALAPRDGGSLPAIRARAIAFIDDNLSAASLRPSSIASGIYVSRAVLYRAFQDDGGVAAFLHRRRLARAQSMLEARAGEQGAVAKVAAAHGYNNVRRFSRQFAAVFSEPPTSFVRRVRAGGR